MLVHVGEPLDGRLADLFEAVAADHEMADVLRAGDGSGSPCARRASMAARRPLRPSCTSARAARSRYHPWRLHAPRSARRRCPGTPSLVTFRRSYAAAGAFVPAASRRQYQYGRAPSHRRRRTTGAGAPRRPHARMVVGPHPAGAGRHGRLVAPSVRAGAAASELSAQSTGKRSSARTAVGGAAVRGAADAEQQWAAQQYAAQPYAAQHGPPSKGCAARQRGRGPAPSPRHRST